MTKVRFVARMTSGMYNEVLGTLEKFAFAWAVFSASWTKFSSNGKFVCISSPSHVNSNSGKTRFTHDKAMVVVVML